MFNFFNMMYNHESRAVDRYEDGDLIVDTCAVTDADQPYETGILHPAYNDGEWVIVEMYDTAENAQEGHNKWVETMTAEKLPDSLKDVGTAGIAQLADAFSGGDDWREYEKD